LKKKIAHTIDVNTLAAITTHAKKVSHGVLLILNPPNIVITQLSMNPFRKGVYHDSV
jgi:hypothetical protein